MIRTKGEPGTGDVIQAVRHMRTMNKQIRELVSLRDDEVYEAASSWPCRTTSPSMCTTTAVCPVVNIACRRCGHPGRRGPDDGTRCGRRVRRFRHLQVGRPGKRAAAIVQATANWQDADLLARLSENLGEAMVGINEDEIETIMAARGE